jgi:transposase
MAKGTPLALSEEERTMLVSWIQAGKTERRLAERARMILALAEGHTNQEIAAGLQTRAARVSKWRTRFARQGLAGLSDAVRDGRPSQYGAQTERRILAVLDEPPPKGWATWSGTLVAQRLGDVSAAYVWQVLRGHRIQLQRRRSWCVSTDPAFAPKAADIVGLYLDPPENAMVLCVDEQPAIQALERAQGAAAQWQSPDRVCP